jgi:hypothetical protein
MSGEIDMLPIADDNPETARLADIIEGVAGEFSPFEELHGFSIDGVDLSTSALPTGWRGRLVKVQNANTAAPDGEPQYTGWCLDKEDLCVAKLCAFRERTGISSQRSYDPGSSTARPSSPDSPPWTSATAERPRWPVRGSVRCKQVIDPGRHVSAKPGPHTPGPRQLSAESAKGANVSRRPQSARGHTGVMLDSACALST